MDADCMAKAMLRQRERKTGATGAVSETAKGGNQTRRESGKVFALP